MLIFNPMVACIIRTSGMQGGESRCGGEVLLDSKGSITGQPCLTQDKTHLVKVMKVQHYIISYSRNKYKPITVHHFLCKHNG